ncbi:MAG: potassium transporter [Sulfurovum sp.]|nr:MAG: potassium transporter [Sulfurovum sp.]
MGSLLLLLPFSHTDTELNFIDALFTSTSATCVTGLIVTSTPQTFSAFGEAVILLLIQIGGIGYMSLLGLMFLAIGNKLSIHDRRMVKESLDLPTLDIGKFLKKIVLMVIAVELIGATILTVRFMETYPLMESIWYGLFHSISAFNNAGFSLFDTNMIGYQKDTIMLLTLSMLIIVGGLGYFVVIELYTHRKHRNRYSLHTKLMLLGTAFLIFGGMFIFLSIEWYNPKTFGSMSFFDKIINGFFLSVNFRTSGFNSIDFSALKESSLFFSNFFMLIGGGQGGTAGGMKVTTVMILAVSAFYILNASNQPAHIFKRTIEQSIINKSLAIIMFTSTLVMIMVLLLVETQDSNLSFIKMLFEVTSAFGTVGLSVGDGGVASLSAKFNDFGKLIIIISMLAGRVGIFAFGFILIGKSTIKHFKYPVGKVII